MAGCSGSSKGESQDGFHPLSIPFIAHRPYYTDSEMEHHYPNMYDFRRAAMMSTPAPIFAPHNRPFVLPKTIPPYIISEDYRKRADWLSNWADIRVHHRYTNVAMTKLPRY